MRAQTLLLIGILLTGGWAQTTLRTLNSGREGQPFIVTDYLTRGKVTVVEFASKACPRCVALEEKLVILARKNDQIAVSRIDVDRPASRDIDWQSPLLRQYNITSLPHFKIYTASGKLLAEGEAARRMVSTMLIEAEVI